MREITEREQKIQQALAYLEHFGNTQAARHAAAQNDELIDTSQWRLASLRFRQEKNS